MYIVQCVIKELGSLEPSTEVIFTVICDVSSVAEPPYKPSFFLAGASAGAELLSSRAPIVISINNNYDPTTC